MIHSRVHYCIEVYANATWNVLQPLHVACNRVLRTLQGLSRFSNVKDLYVAYDVLPIHLLHKFCMAKLIYKCLNSNPAMPTVILVSCIRIAFFIFFNFNFWFEFKFYFVWVNLQWTFTRSSFMVCMLDGCSAR